MHSPSRVILWLGTLSVLMVCAVRADTSDSEGWASYREFLTACETATSMDQVLPYLPEWRRERHEAADEEERKKTLERLCHDTDDYEDIAPVSEEADESKTVLHLKAKWNDFPMKGRVVLVREGEDLKVEEWFWATGESP